MEKYEVRNTTVKPVRKDASGKDLRSAAERVGHPVQWRDTQDRVQVLAVGRHKIVSEVDNGLMSLARVGFISIIKLKDISVALKAHTFKSSDARPSARDTKATAAKEAGSPGKAKATEMGRQDHSQISEATGEYEGAVNPDGQPNFVAKRATRRRKSDGQPAGSDSDETEQ